MVKSVFLPVAIAIMSIIYIFFIPEEPLLLKLFFKLVPMILIILYAAKRLPKEKRLLHWLILAGLFFCAIGDATLHWFVVGLSAFLIGHVFYLAGFFTQWQFTKLRAIFIVPIALYGVVMGSILAKALQDAGDAALMLPVLLYILVISTMAWSAIMSGNKFTIAGSLLFVISDSILAWNMFVEPVPSSHLLIMSTYYGAQFLIAHSLQSFSGKKEIA